MNGDFDEAEDADFEPEWETYDDMIFPDDTPDEIMEYINQICAQRDRLRAALVGLVGVDGRDELEQMEVVMRLMPAPAEDKAATVDAIHALIATLPPT